MAQKQPQRAPYSSVAALVMARAQKRLAEKYEDQELAQHAAALEERALAAVKDGTPELAPLAFASDPRAQAPKDGKSGRRTLLGLRGRE